MDAGDYNRRFDSIFQKMDRDYDRYAKSCGMSYSSLAIFQLIWERQPCTQKQLCDITMLPKQTVNSIVLSFLRQGYIEMLDLPEDRRNKAISLSVSGMDFANRIFPKIKCAEDRSMQQFSAQERHVFFELLERFASTFSEELNK